MQWRIGHNTRSAISLDAVFFGYVLKYSLPVLLPIFAVVAWLFLR